MPKTSRTRGFTLVELLVVIAIIGVLVALLLPAVQAAREAARRNQCLNNLKQIGLGVLNYEQARGEFPHGSTTKGTALRGPHFSTWSVDILPYLEQPAVYDLWDPKKAFTHSNNRRLRETFLQSYLCPSDTDLTTLAKPESGPGDNQLWAPGSYRAMSGYSLGVDGDHFWDNPRAAQNKWIDEMPYNWRGAMHTGAPDLSSDRSFQATKLKHITDGTSHTFLVGEYHTATHQSRRTFWAYAYTSYNQSSAFPESRTLLADYDKCRSIPGAGEHICKRAWGSFHTGGVIQFVFCDGSAHPIDPDVGMDLFVATATIQNEEPQSLPID